jgi:hypothetical protein
MVNASLKIDKESSAFPRWLNLWPNRMYKLMLNNFDKLDDKILDLMLYFEDSMLRSDRNF